jgi:hypothetical protein
MSPGFVLLIPAMLFDLEGLLQEKCPSFDHYLPQVSRVLRDGLPEQGYIVVADGSLRALRMCLDDLHTFRRSEHNKLAENWPAVEDIRCGRG